MKKITFSNTIKPFRIIIKVSNYKVFKRITLLLYAWGFVSPISFPSQVTKLCREIVDKKNTVRQKSDGAVRQNRYVDGDV